MCTMFQIVSEIALKTLASLFLSLPPSTFSLYFSFLLSPTSDFILFFPDPSPFLLLLSFLLLLLLLSFLLLLLLSFPLSM